jgi:putative ABC transport system substrate-binding protein
MTPRKRWVALAVALLLSFAARDAAPESMPRIGFLTSMPPWSGEQVFRETLRELGYAEGKNVLIEWRRGPESDEGLEPLAVELVRLKVDVIVTFRTRPTRAALKATSAIPVVFTGVADAIQSGLVTNLARPAGNATGVTLLSTELATKRLDLLRQFAPRARKVAYLVNRTNPVSAPQVDALRTAAVALGLQLEISDVRGATQEEVDRALHELRGKAIDGLVVGSDAILLATGAKIAQAVRAAKMPTVFPWREYHEYGVVVSYGPDLREGLRRGAYFVNRLLKGARPSDLPVEQVSKVELIVDLRAARSMGVQVPEPLLYRADQVIR